MLIISVLLKPLIWYEIGVIQASITHVKSHTTALDFWLPTRYKSDISGAVHPWWSWGSKNGRSQIWRLIKNLPFRPTSGKSVSSRAKFFQLSTLPSGDFAASCSTRMQSTSLERCDLYLFGNHKLKAVLWNLTCVMLPESTPISDHTEDFVKTEIMSILKVGAFLKESLFCDDW